MADEDLAELLEENREQKEQLEMADEDFAELQQENYELRLETAKLRVRLNVEVADVQAELAAAKAETLDVRAQLEAAQELILSLTKPPTPATAEPTKAETAEAETEEAAADTKPADGPAAEKPAAVKKMAKSKATARTTADKENGPAANVALPVRRSTRLTAR